MEKNKNTDSRSLFAVESYQPMHKAASHFARLDRWLKTHPKIVLPIITVVLLLIGGFIWWFMREPKPMTTEVKPRAAAPLPPPQKFYSPLTGVEATEADTKRPVTGVMVENSPDARPQSGLKDAGIIFESVAEGGITRFLLLFQETKPQVVGPVRSVRPQFASLVAAFDAGLAHVGGSDIPLAKLRSGQIKDLDQFFNAGAYYRASDRYAPHNVYTSDDRLQALNQAKGYTASTYTPWNHKKTAAGAPVPTAKSIEVPVSSGLYTVHYDYDPAINSYLRSEGGLPHNDREKGRLAPRVVIAMQVPHDIIRDSNNYRYPDVIGSGRAWLFQDGTAAEISWSKASDKEQVNFKDPAGNPVELSPGQTWVTLIRPDRTPNWQ